MKNETDFRNAYYSAAKKQGLPKPSMGNVRKAFENYKMACSVLGDDAEIGYTTIGSSKIELVFSTKSIDSH